MMRQQEAEEEEQYWDDIIDIKYTMFNDDIDPDELLNEGVLYWMTIESIQNLRKRARSGKDPEARKQMDDYMTANEKLDLNFREEEEKDKGAIEERGDFKIAKQLRDIDAAQHIVYEYARG
eukprot:1301945-Amphidinium_carterae.1